ncbi:1914_t:CDS:2, partial [Racocetra persica]
CSKPETDITYCPKLKDWGLTYDDGPSANTPAILDHLKQNNQKATFFVIGSRVFQNPEILKRTVDE